MTSLITARRVSLLIVAIAIVLAVLLVVTPSRVWVLSRGHLPQGNVILWLVLILGVAFASVLSRPSLRPSLVGIAATAMYVAGSTASLGDRAQWLAHMRSKELFVSEPLAQFVYSLVHSWGGDPGLVPVIAGFAFAFVYLRLAQQVRGNAAGDWFTVVGTYLATSLHLVFFRGFVENPPLALPLVLLFVGAALKHMDGGQPKHFYVAAVAGAAAGLLHGSTWFVLPAWWLTLLVVGRNAGAWPTAWKMLASALATHAVTVGAFAATVLLLGYRFSLGNALGGGDAGAFVPLLYPTAFAPATFFSRDHWLRVANICFAGSPLFFVGAMAALRSRDSTPRALFLGLLALAYIGFISLWNFDLAFPGDYDLMFSLSPLLALWTCFVTRGVRGVWLTVLAAVAVVSAWSVVQPFVRLM